MKNDAHNLKGHIARLLKPDTRVGVRQTHGARGGLRLADQLIGLALAAATLALLLATPDMGFTRDEGFYFHAAKEYLGWFEELEQNMEEGDSDASFTQENIDKHWSYNPEHPVLMKASFSLSYRSLSQERDWLAPSTAMRFPTMLFIAVLIWLMYLFMAEAFDRIGGIFACVSLMAMPRFFFHAHLACFDAAMATMWFAVIWAYWKSLDKRHWAWIAAVVWGISLGTKLNAFFIPGVLLMHWALNGWADFGLDHSRHRPVPNNGADETTGTGGARGVLLRLPKVPLAFFTMIVVGPLIFYLMWPRHWYDTFNRIFWYFERHLGHEHYAVQYFGELLALPPFPKSFPYVMSVLTIPVVTLACFVLGIVALMLNAELGKRVRFVARRIGWSVQSFATRLFSPRTRPGAADGPPVRDYAFDPRGTVLLMALATWIPFFIISRPDTPIFGGTKHWSTAMPFFACFAGIGFSWALRQLLAHLGAIRGGLPGLGALRRPVARGAVTLGLLPIVAWPAVRDVVHSHPNGTAYYNELIGGYAGAADAGMHRQFWGYASRSGLEWLNENADENAAVHWHNTLLYSYEMYKEDGLLREDIRPAWSVESAQFVMYHHQRAFHPFLYEIWATYETTSPVYVVSIDGVPVLSIYENPRRRSKRRAAGK